MTKKSDDIYFRWGVKNPDSYMVVMRDPVRIGEHVIGMVFQDGRRPVGSLYVSDAFNGAVTHYAHTSQLKKGETAYISPNAPDENLWPVLISAATEYMRTQGIKLRMVA